VWFRGHFRDYEAEQERRLGVDRPTSRTVSSTRSWCIDRPPAPDPQKRPLHARLLSSATAMTSARQSRHHPNHARPTRRHEDTLFPRTPLLAAGDAEALRAQIRRYSTPLRSLRAAVRDPRDRQGLGPASRLRSATPPDFLLSATLHLFHQQAGAGRLLGRAL